ncbi:hypothetical protein [Sulfuricystis multivorans]|uniref:hypothetical protein n=1 Tax=Sulfuricystis multivorans TaxID=2211108 RepID=UPI000F8426B4|nr:hypothetical protein [Sulfuricystis multivorans]
MARFALCKLAFPLMTILANHPILAEEAPVMLLAASRSHERAANSAGMVQETPVPRSSHPRGFTSDAPLPPLTAPNAKAPAGGTAASNPYPTTPAVATPRGAQQSSRGGVNITGNTRLDARSQGATATAVGQQNAAGNRVGAIGGK